MIVYEVVAWDSMASAWGAEYSADLYASREDAELRRDTMNEEPFRKQSGHLVRVVERVVIEHNDPVCRGLLEHLK